MFSDVLRFFRCSQDALNCSQIFCRHSQMCSNVPRCSKVSQMFTVVHKCYRIVSDWSSQLYIIVFYLATVQSADKLVVKEQILMNSEADTNLDLLFLRWMLFWRKYHQVFQKFGLKLFSNELPIPPFFIVLSMLY